MSRAPAAAEQPLGFTAPRLTGLIKLKASQAIFIYTVASKLTKSPEADKSTPTSDFDGDVGGRSILEGIHARVHASIVSSGLVESAQKKRRHVSRQAGNTHTHRRTCTCTDLYSVYLLEVRVSGISSPFFIQKLSWWTPCKLVRLHCSMRTSPSTGSTACSEALIIDSVKDRRSERR